MNASKIILVALALCLCLAVPVMAAHASSYENKYTAYKPPSASQSTPVEYNLGGCHYGLLVLNTNTMNVFGITEVGIRNDDFDNGAFRMFPINPDGMLEEILIPGHFTLMFPESPLSPVTYAKVTIVNAQASIPELL